MTIFNLLLLRSQWEEMVQDFKLNDFNGTIDNLEYFLNHGAKGNRFRSNFKEAQTIAETIINNYGLMESLGRKLER